MKFSQTSKREPTTPLRWRTLGEYGICGLLLQAIWSLYCCIGTLVYIAGSKLDLFLVDLRLSQACSLSQVHFIIFMDKVSQSSHWVSGSAVTGSRLCFLQMFWVDWWLPSCTGVVCSQLWNSWDPNYHLQVWGHDSQPEKALVEEFKYLVLVHKLGRVQKLDRWIGAASAVIWMLCQSVMVKKELTEKAKLLIYQLIYTPTLTCGHELC